MDEVRVGIQALRYRVVLKEIVGFFIMLLVSIMLIVALSYFRIANAFIYGIGVFIILAVVEFLLILIPAFLEYNNMCYEIEQNSLTLKRGMFSVDTETIPFQKIKNASFEQSFFQRLFSVGNIIIDQDDEKFIWVSVDARTAHTIMETVASRSNIQPITVATMPQNIQRPYSK